MGTISYIKHVCDRCGNSWESECNSLELYPKDWQHISLGQTGAKLDLCEICNEELLEFLKSKGAAHMQLATHNSREVI